MEKLTPQMEAFCQGIADGLSQSEAYRNAYPKAKAWKPATLHPQASKLMANHKVATRVNELRNELAKNALWTRKDSVIALVDACELAQAKGNTAGIVGAVRALNVMHGYNEPAKYEVSANASTLDVTKLSSQARRELLEAGRIGTPLIPIYRLFR